MKSVFHRGDKKTYSTRVKQEDIARFESGVVHQVYSTFALARDAEWSGRLFVLDMKEEHEEGIGVHISVDHLGPAFIGEEVCFVATFEDQNEKGEVFNSYEAFVGERLIASGRQVQRILPKERIEKVFSALSGD